MNIFLFTSYNAAKQQKEAMLTKGAKALKKMERELDEAESQRPDQEWLLENPPVVGTHGGVGAELATYTEKSALNNGVTLKKRPSPQREDTEEVGAYRSARVKVLGNASDRELYLWLTDLQAPQQSRSITQLRISPQRDDPARVDCELEVTQWFTPEIEEASVTTD
ncbi:MAG: hypothetical protein KJO21_13055 [Verrucomicrobiae bacterium]|nr:hypothetical protein [Verrucomicrobiae bacterium]NNJ44235.1 hypothetical protein [Akkermansiaceae bacterium]